MLGPVPVHVLGTMADVQRGVGHQPIWKLKHTCSLQMCTPPSDPHSCRPLHRCLSRRSHRMRPCLGCRRLMQPSGEHECEDRIAESSFQLSSFALQASRSLHGMWCGNKGSLRNSDGVSGRSRADVFQNTRFGLGSLSWLYEKTKQPLPYMPVRLVTSQSTAMVLHAAPHAAGSGALASVCPQQLGAG